MSNFASLLNKPVSEIEAPRPLPVGTYLVIVDGQPEHKQIGKNQTDAFVFKLKFAQPGPDVDQAAMLEALKGKSLSEVTLNWNVFLTEDSAWRMRKFLEESLGIPGGTRGLGEMIPEAMGKSCYATIGHRASDDGSQVFMEVKGTTKA